MAGDRRRRGRPGARRRGGVRRHQARPGAPRHPARSRCRPSRTPSTSRGGSTARCTSTTAPSRSTTSPSSSRPASASSYADSEGVVRSISEDGTRMSLGTMNPDTPMVSQPRAGWVAWTEPDGGGLVVYDVTTHREAGRVDGGWTRGSSAGTASACTSTARATTGASRSSPRPDDASPTCGRHPDGGFGSMLQDVSAGAELRRGGGAAGRSSSRSSARERGARHGGPALARRQLRADALRRRQAGGVRRPLGDARGQLVHGGRDPGRRRVHRRGTRRVGRRQPRRHAGACTSARSRRHNINSSPGRVRAVHPAVRPRRDADPRRDPARPGAHQRRSRA